MPEILYPILKYFYDLTVDVKTFEIADLNVEYGPKGILGRELYITRQ